MLYNDYIEKRHPIKYKERYMISMTREEFRDYVDFLRSQNEISYDVYSGLIDGIDTLDQAQKTGHWVRWYEIIEQELCTIHDPHCKCSECNYEYDPYIASLFNYCPNCGAKMESEGEE